jgi:hypothetical protein
MRTRRDLLIDAKSKQIPPASSRHTVPHATAHTPAGSSDMVVANLGGSVITCTSGEQRCDRENQDPFDFEIATLLPGHSLLEMGRNSESMFTIDGRFDKRLLSRTQETRRPRKV